MTKLLASGSTVFKVVLLADQFIDTTHQEQQLQLLSTPCCCPMGMSDRGGPLRVSTGHPGFSRWSGSPVAGRKQRLTLQTSIYPDRDRQDAPGRSLLERPLHYHAHDTLLASRTCAVPSVPLPGSAHFTYLLFSLPEVQIFTVQKLLMIITRIYANL